MAGRKRHGTARRPSPDNGSVPDFFSLLLRQNKGLTYLGRRRVKTRTSNIEALRPENEVLLDAPPAELHGLLTDWHDQDTSEHFRKVLNLPPSAVRNPNPHGKHTAG